MNNTPETVNELLNLNEKKALTGEEVLEMIDTLSPTQTIRVTDYLLKKLESFHYSVCADINKGKCEEPIRVWEHDAYVLTHTRQMYNNLSDFND